MYIVEEDKEAERATTHVMRSRYYAISPNHVARLMEEAGFGALTRLDDGVTHPAIVVATRHLA